MLHSLSARNPLIPDPVHVPRSGTDPVREQDGGVLAKFGFSNGAKLYRQQIPHFSIFHKGKFGQVMDRSPKVGQFRSCGLLLMDIMASKCNGMVRGH